MLWSALCKRQIRFMLLCLWSIKTQRKWDAPKSIENNYAHFHDIQYVHAQITLAFTASTASVHINIKRDQVKENNNQITPVLL